MIFWCRRITVPGIVVCVYAYKWLLVERPKDGQTPPRTWLPSLSGSDPGTLMWRVRARARRNMELKTRVLQEHN